MSNEELSDLLQDLIDGVENLVDGYGGGISKSRIEYVKTLLNQLEKTLE